MESIPITHPLHRPLASRHVSPREELRAPAIQADVPSAAGVIDHAFREAANLAAKDA